MLFATTLHEVYNRAGGGRAMCDGQSRSIRKIQNIGGDILAEKESLSCERQNNGETSTRGRLWVDVMCEHFALSLLDTP